jgi:hypothetical protein
VGILISNNIADFKLVNNFRDIDGNILLLDAELFGSKITLGALYGPNHNDNQFFESISRELNLRSDREIILGGDLNATWDTREKSLNLDILNMNSVPSVFRSEKFQQIAASFDLTDPYRFKHPLTKDYTFIPNCRLQNNRSRIDWFLISSTLCDRKMDCWIEKSKNITCFDHKMIGFLWGAQKKDQTKMSLSRIKSWGINQSIFW